MYIIEKSLSIAKSIFPQVYDTSVNRNFHFAFAFYKRKLLTIGTNDMSTESSYAFKLNRRFNLKQKYLFKHAEQDAIGRLWGKVHIDHRIRFVVIRLNRYYEIGESKPCEYCSEILNALGVRDVYWSTARGNFWSKEGVLYV